MPEALNPMDATPRMTPETAGRLVKIIESATALGVGSFYSPPAIGVYIWTGGLVKEVVNETDAEETIYRLLKAIETAKKKAKR